MALELHIYSNNNQKIAGKSHLMHKLKFPNKTIPLKNLQIFRITCLHLQLQPHPKPKAPPSLKFKKTLCKL